MTNLRVPPGRAGRLWLRHRLATAERGAELLEQKSRALREHQARLAERARAAREEWEERAGEAREWLLREALAGGQRELRLAEPAEPVEVTFTWTTVMGVRYPADAAVTGTPMGPPSTAGSTAVVRTGRAFRAALEAGARHAAAVRAQRTVDAEIAATTQRIRSLRRHWIPRLTAALRHAELELEEQERAEGIRHRWAAAHQTRPSAERS
ncbi:V-type ATP synthase subunit D [Amycolatopsis mongoliensis]|uniref:V-type ATP synthase subunit D n=1 Tax=Amycolatopsis mongoliensis TaxID=715475 RepID=A0A9Y2JNI4_9PSEU|nr:V-type ATP synthase subunit D [Amycolatopsis sp. 4-36]WIY00522.1 V-type ATP synthase subunit D [Amycolatopsis sp. 4-36]